MIDTKYKVKMKNIQNKYKFKIFAYDSFSAKNNKRFDKVEMIYNALAKVTDEGTGLTFDDVAECPLFIDKFSGNVSQDTTTGKNKFDKDNVNYTNAFIDKKDTSKFNFNNLSGNSIYIEIKPNTTYTVSGKNTLSNVFSLATSIQEPAVNITITNSVVNENTDTTTITSGNSDNFLLLFFNWGQLSAENLRTIYNTIQIEEGSIATAYEEYTGGQASPNPDYPQDIHVVSGENEIDVESKNYFDKDNAVIINAYVNGNTGQCINGAQGQRSVVIPIEPNTDYVVGGFDLATGNKGIFDEYPVIGTSVATLYSNAEIWHFKSTQHSKYLVVLYKTVPQTYGYDNAYVKKETIKYPLSLDNIELCEIGNYQDYIFQNRKDNPYYNSELELNEWYLHKEINKRVFDGSEDWKFYNIGNRSKTWVFYLTKSNFTSNYIATNGNNLLSNYFISMPINTTYNNDFDGIALNENNTYCLQISISRDIVSDDPEEFKTWLSTHNLIIFYVLETPTNTKITSENYPTLYQQLKNIEYATSFKGQTNISQTNADLPMIINASAVYDLNKLLTRVATLEAEN